MTDIYAPDALGYRTLHGSRERYFEHIGHTVAQGEQGRSYVRVVIVCVHGEDDKTFTTNHDEVDRVSREQRASVIDRAIELHRANLLDNHRVVCNCRVPESLRADRDD